MNKITSAIQSIGKELGKYVPRLHIVRETRGGDGVDGRVIAYVDRNSHISEQYKTLRTNLYSLSPDKSIKTVAITSSQSWEGKTVTCCNLAVTLSYDKEKKVLLIDADLRKSAVHAMFGLPGEPGLSEILDGRETTARFTAKPARGDLYIIPAGNAKDDPTGILHPARIEPVISRLKQEFDYIIFDTPPVLEFTDACIVGALCDAVIPVVKAASTQEHAIEDMVNLLVEAQAAPKAFILTNAHHLLDSHYSFYKYKHLMTYGKKE